VEKHVYSCDCEILDHSKSSSRTTSFARERALLFRRFPSNLQKERHMDREHVRGVADKAKGTIKETAGKVSGDRKLESEGKVDKAKGDIHNAAGDVKDAARKLSK
jgi:uncharacterized protein YjbJ (UPF0337 family)